MRSVIIEGRAFLPLKGKIKRRGTVYVLPIPKVLIESEYFEAECDYRIYFERVSQKEKIFP